MIDDPSIFKLIRKDTALVRVLPTFAFTCGENAVRWKWKIPQKDWSRVGVIVQKIGEDRKKRLDVFLASFWLVHHC